MRPGTGHPLHPPRHTTTQHCLLSGALPGDFDSGGLGSAEPDEDGKDVRQAQEDVAAAWKDMRGLFSARSGTASALQQQVISLLQQRLETLRAALSEFTVGYSQGLQEVCTLSQKRSPALNNTSACSLYAIQTIRQ
jgi:hypothetical protein